ncbi:hypothetical protein P12x_002533 [Tundrisphaera lichenicola]|uniref:hypothetical protein n=1 Tax=Tundrisphaera lichenicola TaxID=2029860 RepID=UPI003EBDD5B5
MPVKRLPLLQLGGKDQFALYQCHYDQIFEVDQLHDPLGRVIYFPPNMCRHICFTGDPKSEDPRNRVVWEQDRAECLEWLRVALVDPGEIRPNHQQPAHEAYLLEVLQDQIVAKYPAYYYVSVKPDKLNNRVILLTGYPVNFDYWLRARRGNIPIWKRKRR